MKSARESDKVVRKEFDNIFDLPLSAAQAWPLLSDIRRTASCIPGVELTDVVDDTTYRGRMSVQLGPAALRFATVVKFEEVDPVQHTARLRADGADDHGLGGEHAIVSFALDSAGADKSRVRVHTDLTLFGPAAQYGDSANLIQGTAGNIITQFAENLRAQLSAAPAAQ